MATATLSTSGGDGGLTVLLDSYGAFGSLGPGGNATYDPIGTIDEAGTTFESAVAIRIGDSGGRTFLSSSGIGSSGNLGDVSFVSSDGTTAESSFSFGDLNFDLDQVVSETFQGGNRSGSLLTQTYEITNSGSTAISFELIRYIDGDLLFDGSLVDGGGRLVNGTQEILFETDQAGQPDTSTTFFGITSEGGDASGSGRFEVDAFPGLQSRIITGTELDDTVTGDGPDADQFVEAGAGYDITLALRNKYVLNPGESTIYTTNTIFGSGAPEDVPNLDYALSGAPTSLVEGNSSAQQVVFTVTRSGATQEVSSVDYAISGTAANGSDYSNIGGTSGANNITGTINFAAGETTKSITLDVTGDTDIESDETIEVSLSNGTSPGTSTISERDATITILNDDQNRAPSAGDDDSTTSEGVAVLIDVLDNDSDADGDELRVEIVTEGRNGSVTLNSDDTVTYTPNTGFSGRDTFIYEISDGELTDSATVTVDVSPSSSGSIAGKVWNDLDGDGSSIGEPGLGNVQVYIDANNNGALDDEESVELTDDNTGSYRFENLEAGSYVVREVVPQGFSQTFPIGSDRPTGDGFADALLEYFDSGEGPQAGPYGIDTDGQVVVPVSADVVLGSDDSDALSLPRGSFVTVGFTDEAVVDGPGDDIFVLESGAAGDQAEIFVSSNLEDFVSLGVGDGGRTSSFDLSDIDFIEPVRAVKIVGLDNRGESPGFDVVNVRGLPESVASPDFYTIDLSEGETVESVDFGNTEVEPPSGPLEVTISSPSRIGAGGTDFVTVTYTNRGDTDLTAPLLELSATGAKLVPIGGTEFSEDSIQFLGINDEGLAGVLPAGASNSFVVEFQSTADAGQRIDFSASTVDPEEVIDWDGLRETLKPDYLTDEAWDATYDNFVISVGTTAKDYETLLAQNASYLSEQGEYVADAGRLVGFEFQQASDYQALALRNSLGSFGRGRFFIGDNQAETDAEGNVSVINAGARRSFTLQSDGTYASTAGDFGSLVRTDDGLLLTEQSGTTTQFTADGQLDFLEDTNGNRIVAEYNSGELTELVASNGDSTTFVRNSDSFITQATDSLGRTTTYTYDGELLASVTAPEGTTSYTYNNDFAVTSVTDGNGTQVNFEYDDRGRLVRESIDEGEESITYDYGENGEVTVTDASGAETQLFLNDRGQVSQLTDALGRTLRLNYDTAGNVVGIDAPEGSDLGFVYDDKGNLITQIDPLGQRTEFIYEPSFNSLSSVTDARGNAISYAYDESGNLTSIGYADSSFESFGYDDDGNVTRSVNRRGQTIEYTYNSRGQLLRQDNADGTFLAYAYDDRGNLVSAEDEKGTTELEYDSADRLTKITYANGRSLAYTYDAGGRRTSMTEADGNQVNYGYDEAGRLAELTDENDDLIVSYAYDEVGRLAREDNGNGTYTTYTYDSAGQVTSIFNYAPNDSVNSSYVYSYDALGQQTGVATLDGEWSYSYDAIGQLTGAVFASTNPDIPDQDLSYAYDAAGNRTQTVVNGEVTNYVANELNQYESTGATVYDYDADGNLIFKADGDSSWIYEYNNENRLVRVVEDDGSETLHEYDALGNRTAATYDGIRTEYLIDPFGLGDVVAEYIDGGLVAQYSHGIGLVNRDDGTTDAFYDFNAIGSTAGLTDSTGTQLNSYTYTPFGSELFEIETVENSFEFVGQWGVSEEANGLDFMRARFYDNKDGRFNSTDPLGFASGDPNLYRYAFNIPNTLIDPSGEIIPLIIGGAISGAVFNTIFSAASSFYCGEIPTGRQLAGAALGGAIGGAIGGVAGPLGGTIAKGLGRAASGITGKLATSAISGIGGAIGQEVGDFIDPSSTAVAAGTSLLGGAASTAISVKGISTLKQNKYFGPRRLGTLLSSPNGRRISGSLGISAIVAGLGNFASGCNDTPPMIEPSIPYEKEVADSSTDINQSNPTPNPPNNQARSKGEPHLTTFDGVGYDFQGAGEFTLVKSLEGDLNIQVRYVEIDPRVTVASAVATILDGKRVVIDSEGIEFIDGRPVVSRSSGSGVAKVTVDGEVVEIPSGGSIDVGNSKIFRSRGEEYTIVYAGEDGTVTDGDDQLIVNYLRPGTINIVDVALGDEKKEQIVGLLGNLNDNADDDVSLPDGTVLARPLPFEDLYGDYREGWRVKDVSESLFDYEEGQGPDTFYNPDFPPIKFTYADLDPVSKARGDAAALAAGYTPGTFEFESAAFDFAVTGDEGFLEGSDTDPEVEIALSIDPIDPIDPDKILGTDLDDILIGSSIDDVIEALGGNDIAAGDLGKDTILGGPGDDILRGDLNSRNSQVGIGDDDIIRGGAGRDRIGGKGGNDTLFGGDDDDRIWGDDGDDIIRGGAGNDTLTGDDFSGGQGADTFVLASGEGTDTITDFEVDRDRIGLADGLSLGSLSFEGETISLNEQTLAVLTGVDTTTLTADSFVSV
ncbi:RHS Repeat family [Synechococcus sp. PCC 7335]|uniref:Ig-like domain-containing protein n=1 Tax=Synechococcus sp. (strain ATCC 29403 / PCC 7335) TaxID=91464 RepID=UPI00017EC6FD|nr:Ig-like domain-containing protein [Synechococcus sp. PCC 7335]EDX85032.1 RHS Repeat family [Synechococcus sp. PCC 7335]